MTSRVTLTEEEFNGCVDLFRTLEIESNKVIGKNYHELSKFFKIQYNKLILVNHPDKGGDKDRFDRILKAYKELKEYIKPLELGNPCARVNVNAESDGRLTAREFYYRKKLFEKLQITQEEVVGKNLEELFSVIINKHPSLGKDLKDCSELEDQINKISQDQNLAFFEKNKRLQELNLQLNEHLTKSEVQFSIYIFPLKEKQNLILEDKKNLALKLIERKNKLLIVSPFSILPLGILNTITIGCYLSWWVIAFNIISSIVHDGLISRYNKKYQNNEISTDEFISKMRYIQLSNKFITYSVATLSVYLLATNFISNGITTGGVILGAALSLAILTEVLTPIFLKGCEIYTEKHTKDLLEEDPKNRVQKETDLLKCYDPRKLIILIIMPLVKKSFKEVAEKLAERNMDEVNTEFKKPKSSPAIIQQGAKLFD